MKKEPQNNRKEESGPQDFNLFPARDYNRWAYLINEVAEMAGASKYDQYQLIKKAADFVKANPGATIHERELFLEKLMESLPISWELAEGEAYLLLQGLQSISFGEIAGSTNATYFHYMGLVLQAGELAARLSSGRYRTSSSCSASPVTMNANLKRKSCLTTSPPKLQAVTPRKRHHNAPHRLSSSEDAVQENDPCSRQ